ncbi:MAG TPA: sterol desaturase family protein [Flavobacteriales bacterium]|nr:sterol desaturase family protein [Flavobacteriales bacterium]
MNFIDNLMAWTKSLSWEQSLILIFVIFIFCEWLVGRMSKLKIHNLHDSLRNVAIGAVSFAGDFLFTILTLPVWIYLFHHIRLFEFEQGGAFMFIVLFILLDFSEYWFHRLSHRVNLLWQAHVVHHQSNFFNLTVGLRTSLFVPLFNIFFYSLFPLLGFDPEHVMLVILIQGIYQLFIHTELVGKLGFLEYLIVTPSAHRVHHGKNQLYLDKNYGKFLIVWDQLFGTWQRETEQVEFGITKPMEKQGVVYSMMEPFRNLFKAMRLVKNIRAWRILLFKSPTVAGKLQEALMEKAQMQRSYGNDGSTQECTTFKGF